VKQERHLREAARTGLPAAMLAVADQFGDPDFFEKAIDEVDADPVMVAEIANRLGRPLDARKWLTVAATSGDVDAMRQLIEDHDQDDLLRCWTWVYLARLAGTDLMADAYRAIHEDGSDYDDDIGGPMYADGRYGVVLEALPQKMDAVARHQAHEIFARINAS
jgi:TPR repeat protein